MNYYRQTANGTGNYEQPAPLDIRVGELRRGAMEFGIRRRWLVAGLSAALALPVAGLGSATASPVDGTWIIKDLVLHIFDCQKLVCGQIIWIRDAARRPSQCGRTIVWGLQATAPNEWTEGSITDPDNETTYRLSATFEADGTLHARIFKGVPIFGKTEILRRVDAQKLEGRCT